MLFTAAADKVELSRRITSACRGHGGLKKPSLKPLFDKALVAVHAVEGGPIKETTPHWHVYTATVTALSKIETL